MIPIRNKKTDISSDVTKGKALKAKIKKIAEEAATKSIDENIDLDVVIAEISKREKFNQLQIQRLVEESNTVAYNKRYDKLRNSHDRRITFPLASLNGVIKQMGSDAPPALVNPNLSKGKKGEGEIAKAASAIEPSYIHHPNARLQERQNKYLEKVASLKKKEGERKQAQLERERNSTIFKIANSLVMSERMYKNANEIYNTLLNDVPLQDEDKKLITKKAAVISEQLVKNKRSYPGFMVTLKENPAEKVANHVLGEYSLIKEAEQSEKVKTIKVQPTADVHSFTDLIELAKKLQQQQIKLSEQSGSEVK